MTLPPLDNWDVTGVSGPKYKVGPWCCVPSCKKPADHAHHLWRRSFLTGDFYWVELPDGSVVGNVVALCVRHHDNVTGRLGGHRNAIRMTHPDKVFWWCRVGEEDEGLEYEFLAPIEPQPSTREALVASPADTGSETCPTCGQKTAGRPSAPARQGRPRRRKNFNIPVPADAEENGAEVLDTLIADVGVLLGREADANGRYYIVVPALYFAATERERFLESVRGEG
jgi:hypothetical protein